MVLKSLCTENYFVAWEQTASYLAEVLNIYKNNRIFFLNRLRHKILWPKTVPFVIQRFSKKFHSPSSSRTFSFYNLKILKNSNLLRANGSRRRHELTFLPCTFVHPPIF